MILFKKNIWFGIKIDYKNRILKKYLFILLIQTKAYKLFCIGPKAQLSQKAQLSRFREYIESTTSLAKYACYFGLERRWFKSCIHLTNPHISRLKIQNVVIIAQLYKHEACHFPSTIQTQTSFIYLILILIRALEC